MLQDENYILVEVWNEQVGGWQDVDEAKTIDEAFKMIREMQQRNLAEWTSRNYSVASFKRTVVRDILVNGEWKEVM